ncbi:MAG: hypothetical protein NTV00_10940 [Methylococcales bacterium]|nr:hypothetical protein [Methylococcales bacterium]
MRVGFFVMNSFKRSIGVILLLSPLTSLASNNWSYHQENDRLTNRSFSFARSPMPRTDLYDDLRLAVACKDNRLHVIIEAGVLIASQGSAFDVDIQIDKQAPVKVPMRTFPDSKRKGYTDQQAKQIADALLSGQSVFIRVNTMIRRVLSGEMPLDDAAAPIKQVYADCGLTAGSTGTAEYSLVNFNDAFSKLSPEQQRVVLDKLKGIMGELH